MTKKEYLSPEIEIIVLKDELMFNVMSQGADNSDPASRQSYDDEWDYED